MKLRNKKTGEVWNVWSFYDENQTINLKYFNNDEIAILEYHSLAELNTDWEDYKPTEPLIKDEKIRKAVRVWAEAIGVDKVVYADSGWHYEYFRTDQDEHEHFIDINFWSKIDADLLDGATYTITELCGEERE